MEAIIRTLQRDVYKRRIRLSDAFADFDQLRRGVVTRSQFVRVLDYLALHVPVQDQNLLIEHYDDGEERVKWVDFVAEVDLIFTRPGLEKDPHAPLIDPNAVLAEAQASVPEDKREDVEALLNRLKRLVKARGVIVDQPFRDFDIRHDGYVTATQFARGLPLKISAREMELLRVKYEGEGIRAGYINYRQFCRDLGEQAVGEAAPAEAAQPAREEPADREAGLPALSVVLDRIKTQMVTHRLTPDTFLTDFDPLRSGLMFRDRFITALNMAGVVFEEGDVQRLFIEYESETEPGKVEYRPFLQAVRELETIVANTTGRAVDDTLSPEMEEQLKPLIERARRIIRVRGLIPLSAFLDFDKSHLGVVTYPQFRQCLSSLMLTYSPAEVTLLQSAFGPENNGLVRYVNFVKLIDTPEAESRY